MIISHGNVRPMKTGICQGKTIFHKDDKQDQNFTCRSQKAAVGTQTSQLSGVYRSPKSPKESKEHLQGF